MSASHHLCNMARAGNTEPSHSSQCGGNLPPVAFPRGGCRPGPQIAPVSSPGWRNTSAHSQIVTHQSQSKVSFPMSSTSQISMQIGSPSRPSMIMWLLLLVMALEEIAQCGLHHLCRSWPQEVAVRWMTAREARQPADAAAHPTIRKFTSEEGLPVLLCDATGDATVEDLPPCQPCRGGFVCDEPVSVPHTWLLQSQGQKWLAAICIYQLLQECLNN